MSGWKLADMTWEEAGRLDLPVTVAILPVGAVEAHGPHLPLATDVIISEAMAGAAAARLSAAGYIPLILPSLSYTTAEFAAAFSGTISLRAATVSAVVVDIAAELSRHGIRTLAIANSHLDPAHLESLRDAAARAEADYSIVVVFPELIRRPWALRLGDEFLSGACHAGRYETSIVLAARPDAVREELGASLPPNPSSLSAAIRKGQRTFLEAGGPRAYFGDPASAGAAEGEATVAALGDIVAEAVRARVPAPAGQAAAESRPEEPGPGEVLPGAAPGEGVP